MAPDESPGRPLSEAEDREREFSRRQLLRAGSAVPVVLSAEWLAACGSSHSDAHGDHTDAPHDDAAHTDTHSDGGGHSDHGHTDTGGHGDNGHSDTSHDDTGQHSDTAHSDTPQHSDEPAPTHNDVPAHNDAPVPIHNDFPFPQL